MSMRTQWSRASAESPMLTQEWTDCYGQRLDATAVALLLGVDDAYVIEAQSVVEIRDLAGRILTACDQFERAVPSGGLS